MQTRSASRQSTGPASAKRDGDKSDAEYNKVKNKSKVKNRIRKYTGKKISGIREININVVLQTGSKRKSLSQPITINFGQMLKCTGIKRSGVKKRKYKTISNKVLGTACRKPSKKVETTTPATESNIQSVNSYKNFSPCITSSAVKKKEDEEMPRTDKVTISPKSEESTILFTTSLSEENKSEQEYSEVSGMKLFYKGVLVNGGYKSSIFEKEPVVKLVQLSETQLKQFSPVPSARDMGGKPQQISCSTSSERNLLKERTECDETGTHELRREFNPANGVLLPRDVLEKERTNKCEDTSYSKALMNVGACRSLASLFHACEDHEWRSNQEEFTKEPSIRNEVDKKEEKARNLFTEDAETNSFDLDSCNSEDSQLTEIFEYPVELAHSTHAWEEILNKSTEPDTSISLDLSTNELQLKAKQSTLEKAGEETKKPMSIDSEQNEELTESRKQVEYEMEDELVAELLGHDTGNIISGNSPATTGNQVTERKVTNYAGIQDRQFLENTIVDKNLSKISDSVKKSESEVREKAKLCKDCDIQNWLNQNPSPSCRNEIRNSHGEKFVISDLKNDIMTDDTSFKRDVCCYMKGKKWEESNMRPLKKMKEELASELLNLQLDCIKKELEARKARMTPTVKKKSKPEEEEGEENEVVSTPRRTRRSGLENVKEYAEEYVKGKRNRMSVNKSRIEEIECEEMKEKPEDGSRSPKKAKLKVNEKTEVNEVQQMQRGRTPRKQKLEEQLNASSKKQKLELNENIRKGLKEKQDAEGSTSPKKLKPEGNENGVKENERRERNSMAKKQKSEVNSKEAKERQEKVTSPKKAKPELKDIKELKEEEVRFSPVTRGRSRTPKIQETEDKECRGEKSMKTPLRATRKTARQTQNEKQTADEHSTVGELATPKTGRKRGKWDGERGKKKSVEEESKEEENQEIEILSSPSPKLSKHPRNVEMEEQKENGLSDTNEDLKRTPKKRKTSGKKLEEEVIRGKTLDQENVKEMLCESQNEEVKEVEPATPKKIKTPTKTTKIAESEVEEPSKVELDSLSPCKRNEEKEKEREENASDEVFHKDEKENEETERGSSSPQGQRSKFFNLELGTDHLKDETKDKEEETQIVTEDEDGERIPSPKKKPKDKLKKKPLDENEKEPEIPKLPESFLLSLAEKKSEVLSATESEPGGKKKKKKKEEEEEEEEGKELGSDGKKCRQIESEGFIPLEVPGTATKFSVANLEKVKTSTPRHPAFDLKRELIYGSRVKRIPYSEVKAHDRKLECREMRKSVRY